MRVVLFLSFLYIFVFAQTSSKVFDVVDDIAQKSQKISNIYLLNYHKKNLLGYEAKVMALVLSLEEDYKLLSKSIDKENKDILEYLLYAKDRVKSLVGKEPSWENVSEILDITREVIEACRALIHNNESFSDAVGLEILNGDYISRGLGFDFAPSKEVFDLNKSFEFAKKTSWRTYKKLYEKKDLFLPYILMVLSDDLEELK